jgi:hypothetical protein
MSVFSSLRKLFRPEDEKTQAEVRNETRGGLLASAADIADTPASRRRGLLKHDCLAPGQALWIVPCSGVHSYGMKFDIDILYLDRKHRVRKIRRTMKPRRMSICLRAHSVLELSSGMIATSGTRKGDQLSVTLLRGGKC